MRRILLTAMIMVVALCGQVRADAEVDSIRVVKQNGEEVLQITGRIKSRHVAFRKGRSVREYYVVTPDLIKIPLPRSHVEHRDGTISGIYLKLWRGKDVELVCEGRVKDDPEKGLSVTVEKILSLLPAPKS